MFNHLVDISSLRKKDIDTIISAAEDFERGAQGDSCCGKHLCLLFAENSTRTRFSFEMAANKLGINIYNFDADKSSFSKGESMKDTLDNLSAIGIDAVVIRHSEAGIVERAMKEVDSSITFINAGDGNNSHPTQALLDFFTMKKNLGTVEGKKVVIVGDIRHSRVARSNIGLLSKFGAKIYLCAPDYFKDETIDGVTWVDNLEDALLGADVAMFLRIQKERLEAGISLDGYAQKFGLTLPILENYAKKDVLIMHPGPVNRDVELSSEIIDGEYGRVILEQARNGVYVRMAVLDLLLGGKK